jgi:SAM-dependent methyltransferase
MPPTPPNQPTASAGYVFDNDSEPAGQHHDALSTLLDGVSSSRVQRLLTLTGTRCWEVGAGRGGFARWLASKVGDHGTVLATDIKPPHGIASARLRVLRHDVTTDPTPDPHTWDLVHARLLLNHLPSRRQVLHTLASALAPGGVLLTEDWWSEPPGCWVAFTPNPRDAVLLRDYHTAQLAVLDRHGNDRTWATHAHTAMREEGLTDVTTVVSAQSWPGNSAGSRLVAAGLAQLRPELLDAGMTPERLDRVQELLADPAVELHGHRLYSTSGRRPTTPAA